MVGLLVGGGAHFDGITQQFFDACGDSAVHALGIALGHGRAVPLGVFVVVFAPYGDANRRVHMPSLPKRFWANVRGAG
ncbi:hypothetical protein GCM10009841_25750 [Microlunatus panaciterrae]